MKFVERETLTAQQTGIKDWYTKEYPEDDLGCCLKPATTFYDLFTALDLHADVYSFTGVGDSVVRERLFNKLAEIMDVSYDYIYDQWLD